MYGSCTRKADDLVKGTRRQHRHRAGRGRRDRSGRRQAPRGAGIRGGPGAFPNSAALARLAGAPRPDAHDERQVADKRYLP